MDRQIHRYTFTQEYTYVYEDEDIDRSIDRQHKETDIHRQINRLKHTQIDRYTFTHEYTYVYEDGEIDTSIDR